MIIYKALLWTQDLTQLLARRFSPTRDMGFIPVMLIRCLDEGQGDHYEYIGVYGDLCIASSWSDS
jgi:hypothetical protein